MAEEPSPWVVRFAPLVPAAGEVLDVACGAGRHVRFFLAQGHSVTAVDRDVSGLADLTGSPGLTVIEAELEGGGPWPLEDLHFAGVVVTNYLHRPLFPALLTALAPGGALIYETFAAGNERFARPHSPDHLLRRGELLDVVRGKLRVVAFEDMEVAEPRPAVVQRICALAEADTGSAGLGATIRDRQRP
ncbi:MAG: class I SAM-dependent methyltransferase [Alphaproteobacteria bacterium]